MCDCVLCVFDLFVKHKTKKIFKMSISQRNVKQKFKKILKVKQLSKSLQCIFWKNEEKIRKIWISMSVALQYTTDLYIYVGLKIESKLKKKKNSLSA